MTRQLAAALLVLGAVVVATDGAGPRTRLGCLCPHPGRSRVRSFATQLGPSARPLAGAAAVGLLIAVLIGRSDLATGVAGGLGGAAGAFFVFRRALRPQVSKAGVEPFAMAGTWELLAACLRAGLPIAVAVRAVATGLPEPPATALRRTAELLALGAEPAQAWQPAIECPDTERLGRAARRSGTTGAALSGSLTSVASEVRAEARHRAEAKAQRAGVLITAPLGLCFLPAFMVLGIAPVLVGLATQLINQW